MTIEEFRGTTIRVLTGGSERWRHVLHNVAGYLASEVRVGPRSGPGPIRYGLIDKGRQPGNTVRVKTPEGIGELLLTDHWPPWTPDGLCEAFCIQAYSAASGGRWAVPRTLAGMPYDLVGRRALTAITHEGRFFYREDDGWWRPRIVGPWKVPEDADTGTLSAVATGAVEFLIGPYDDAHMFWQSHLPPWNEAALWHTAYDDAGNYYGPHTLEKPEWPSDDPADCWFSGLALKRDGTCWACWASRRPEDYMPNRGYLLNWYRGSYDRGGFGPWTNVEMPPYTSSCYPVYSGYEPIVKLLSPGDAEPGDEKDSWYNPETEEWYTVPCTTTPRYTVSRSVIRWFAENLWWAVSVAVAGEHIWTVQGQGETREIVMLRAFYSTAEQVYFSSPTEGFFFIRRTAVITDEYWAEVQAARAVALADTLAATTYEDERFESLYWAPRDWWLGMTEEQRRDIVQGFYDAALAEVEAARQVALADTVNALTPAGRPYNVRLPGEAGPTAWERKTEGERVTIINTDYDLARTTVEDIYDAYLADTLNATTFRYDTRHYSPDGWWMQTDEEIRVAAINWHYDRLLADAWYASNATGEPFMDIQLTETGIYRFYLVDGDTWHHEGPIWTQPFKQNEYWDVSLKPRSGVQPGESFITEEGIMFSRVDIRSEYAQYDYDLGPLGEWNHVGTVDLAALVVCWAGGQVEADRAEVLEGVYS